MRWAGDGWVGIPAMAKLIDFASPALRLTGSDGMAAIQSQKAIPMRKLFPLFLFCALALNPLLSQGVSESGGETGSLYVPLNPPFVVNIHDGGRLRFMQVQVQVLARDKAAVSAVEHHMPAVRDALILLLSDQKFGQVSRPKGREKARHQALAAVQKILKKNAGVSNAVKALYFTDFVVQ